MWGKRKRRRRIQRRRRKRMQRRRSRGNVKEIEEECKDEEDTSE